MSKTSQEAFEEFWRRVEGAGLPLTDTYEVAVIKAHAQKAFYAGIRYTKRKESK